MFKHAISALALTLGLTLPGCSFMEEGFLFTPFEGPGYDLETGLLAPYTPDQRMIAGSTFIHVAPGKDAMEAFEAVSAPLDAQLADGPEGMVGYSLGRKPGTRMYRTISVWESEEALFNFIGGEPHVSAMARLDEIADFDEESTTVVFEITGADLPLDLGEVFERLETEGHAAY